MLRRLLDSPWTYLGLAGVLSVLLLDTQFEIRVPPRSSGTPDDIHTLAERTDTNLVFVVIDTLRADRVHSYGYQRETSPVMDERTQDDAVGPDGPASSGTPRWVKVFGIALALFVLIFVAQLVLGGGHGPQLHGPSSGRLEATGYGPDEPIAPNDTEEGRAQNRRVEFDILEQGEKEALMEESP